MSTGAHHGDRHCVCVPCNLTGRPVETLIEGEYVEGVTVDAELFENLEFVRVAVRSEGRPDTWIDAHMVLFTDEQN